ncbi:ATP-binding protein [Arthrobacter psychrolactophilus]
MSHRESPTLGPCEVVRVLLEAEATGRNRSMLATRRKRAGFPTGKTFDVWDEGLSTLPVATTSFLRTLEWVRRRENLIACGPSGTGKTLLLESLGQQAIDEGMSVSWLSLEDLGALVRRHRIDDSVNKAITRVTNVDLICIDDIGLLPVSGDAAEGFYRVVEASYEKRSLAISSNIHPSGFDELMPKTIATATVDPPHAPRPPLPNQRRVRPTHASPKRERNPPNKLTTHMIRRRNPSSPRRLINGQKNLPLPVNPLPPPVKTNCSHRSV